MSDLSPAGDATSDGHGAASGAEGAEPAMSAGALIRQARESAGLHIAALAVALKVPVKKLEALEQDRFDLLPDAVFVRALASSVCRTLKIDASGVLDRLPQTTAPKLIYQGTGINAPFRAPGDGPGPTIWAQVSRPAVLAGLAFLLGALVLIFLPAVKQDGLVDKVVAVATPSGAAQTDVSAAPVGAADEGVKMGNAPGQVLEATTATSGQTNSAPAMMSSALVSGTSPVAAAAASVIPDPSPAPATPPSPAAPAVPATTTPASTAAAASTQSGSSASGLLTLRAKGESWVEVVDAKGVVVVRRILTAGEVVGVSGALPMTAVIGRADATQVTVRGQPLDLAPIARDNVARFEVK